MVPIVVNGATDFYLGSRTPTHNSKVENVSVILTVKVLRNAEPLANVWAHFYVDDEWVGVQLTNSDGVARIGTGALDSLGYHSWRVRLDKQGSDAYWSSIWRFNYQPRPKLTLESEYGEVFGEGNYTYGQAATFGIVQPIIEIGEGKRLVFQRWISFQENSYSGAAPQSQVTMINDIRERAEWKTQYYLNMSCDLPKFVFPKSGWYDEGVLLGIRVEPPPGTEFQYWEGSGNESYSGTDAYHTINMIGPVKEEAFFERDEYILSVESEYSDTWGSGVYDAWDNASFGVFDRQVYTAKGVRWVFNGWSSDSKYGYDGDLSEYQLEISENITESASWQRQYFVSIEGGEGGNVTGLSDWLDEGTEINIAAQTLDGYKFTGWAGSGAASYNGLENEVSLIVGSPINETASWKKEYRVVVESELQATGSGTYLDGDIVTIEAQKAEGLIIRSVFKKWSGDIDSVNNPFNFTLHGDMEIDAVYEKNYNIFIGILIAIIGAVGVIFYRMYRE